jgi:DNA-binding NtrC family response regulator
MFTRRGSGINGEVVLLVDDEDSIRRLVRIILESRGYVVLDACNGLEGLAVCRAHTGPIHLLLSDLTMPKLGGRDLAVGALQLRPALKVLFMSGCSEDVVPDRLVEAGVAFLQKPFTAQALEQKVRDTLDYRTEAA